MEMFQINPANVNKNWNLFAQKIVPKELKYFAVVKDL